MSTEQRVREIIAEQLWIALDEVTNDSLLVDDLDADSIDQVEIIMALEEEFNIEISDENAYNLDTVQKLINYVKS